MNTIKEYKHIPTGEIYTKSKNGFYFYKDSSDILYNIPPSIVETGKDWIEVKSLVTSYNYETDETTDFKVNKVLSPNETIRICQVIERALTLTECIVKPESLLNKEEPKRETYSKEDMISFAIYNKSCHLMAHQNINVWLKTRSKIKE